MEDIFGSSTRINLLYIKTTRMADTEQINATLKNDLCAKINEIAKEEKRSFSSMVAILLEEAVDKREKSKK